MAIAIILALIIALVVCLVLYSQMKSVAKKQDAKDYISGSLQVTQRSDVYTHTTQTRRKVESGDKK